MGPLWKNQVMGTRGFVPRTGRLSHYEPQQRTPLGWSRVLSHHRDSVGLCTDAHEMPLGLLLTSGGRAMKHESK